MLDSVVVLVLVLMVVAVGGRCGRGRRRGRRHRAVEVDGEPVGRRVVGAVRLRSMHGRRLTRGVRRLVAADDVDDLPRRTADRHATAAGGDRRRRPVGQRVVACFGTHTTPNSTCSTSCGLLPTGVAQRSEVDVFRGVCLFVQHDNFRTIKLRTMKLGR